MKLDSVESGFIDGAVGGVGVPLSVGLDLFDCQRARGRIGRRHGDSRCSDQFKAGVLGLEQLKVCCATESPKLEEDV